MKWTSERSARAHAAKAALRIQRAATGTAEPCVERLPRGEFLGVLQWHAADGQVRRWVIRQGSRANNITVQALVAGGPGGLLQRSWSWVTASLRRVLSRPRRRIRED